MIVILSGKPGTGKTLQCGGWEEPILYLDTENRAKPTIDKYHSDKVIVYKPCMAYKTDYKEDHIATLNNFENEIKNIECSTVVVDGISDLRDYAVTKWCKVEKRKRPVNPGDWEQVNDVVRDLLFPLINKCRAEGVQLVMTAQFKDEYGLDAEGKSVKVGEVPALKEWQKYNVDTLITLEYQKPFYRAICTKSIVGCWEENITGKSLYELLIEKEMQ